MTPANGIYRRRQFGPFHVLEAAYKPGLRMSPHEDGVALRISIVLAGLVQEDSRGVTEFGSAASVVVKPSDVRHANVFGNEGAQLVSIVIPEEVIPDRRGLSEWTWHHGGPISRDATSLVRIYRTESETAGAVEACTYALLDTLREDTSEAGAPAAVPAWLRRVRERLHEEFAEAYSVAELAEEARVHPVYLTRLFRRHFQCSVTRYVQRLRVRYAAAVLASPRDRSVARLAQEAGFFDQSHFSRTFRNEFGLAPGQFRSIMRLPGRRQFNE